MLKAGAAPPIPPDAALLWAPKVKPAAEPAGVVLRVLVDAALAPKSPPLLCAPNGAPPEAPNAKGAPEDCPVPGPKPDVPGTVAVPCPKAGVVAAAPNSPVAGPDMPKPCILPPPDGPAEANTISISIIPKDLCTCLRMQEYWLICMARCKGRVNPIPCHASSSCKTSVI